MPAIAEEAKRAEKQEVGDLVIEIVGKTTRVYELASTTRLKQIAYSDTLQGQRFLMFSAPSKEIVPAKQFTIARLYRKPEVARKIIAKHFPKYAAAGAKAHLYYSGRGPRGRIGGTEEGYFTVALGMGIGESIDEAQRTVVLHLTGKSKGKFIAPVQSYADDKELTPKQPGRAYGIDRAVWIAAQDLDPGWWKLSLQGEGFKWSVRTLTKTTRQKEVARFEKQETRSGGVARTKSPGIAGFQQRAQAASGRRYNLRVQANAALRWLKESIDEADTVKANVLIDTVPGYQKGRKGSARRWQEGARKTFKNRTIRNVKIVKLAGPGEVQVGMVKLNTLWIFVYQPTTGSPTTWKDVPFQEVDQATGKLKPDPSMVLPEPRGTASSVVSPASISRRRGKKRREKFRAKRAKEKEAGESIEVELDEYGNVVNKVNASEALVSAVQELQRELDEVKAKYDPVNYDGPTYKVGDRVKIVRRFGWKPKYRPTPIKPPVLGKVKQVQKHELYPKGPPVLILTIKPKDFDRATPGVVHTETDSIWVHADEVESQKGGSMDERFDSKAAQDYVKGIKDRKRRAYAREYLKAVRGARLPPQPKDYKITTQDAKEVEAGFKRLGAPLAASIQRNAPTFEQVTRIVRRAKCAGFSPNRITLCERFDSSGVPDLRRQFVKRPKKSPISADDYIFVIHHEEEDTYSVAHSVHDNPRLGYQELQTGLSMRVANRVERKLKARWKAAKVRRFLVTGHGHKREWLPESDEEKTKRIKAAVDLEINDPKNKGRTIAQTLLAIFGQDVDEARKWTPVWTTTANRPWRIADQDGKVLRKPKEGNVHQAYAFKSVQDALKFLKSSKGKKAVTTQESIDEHRFGTFSKGLPMISKAKAHKEIDRLGKEYKKYKKAGDTAKAGEAWAIMRGLAQMANMDPENVLKLAGVEEVAGLPPSKDEATTITPNDMKMASLALLKKIKSIRWEEMSAKEALRFATLFIKKKLSKVSMKQAEQVALVTLNLFVSEDTDEARAKIINKKTKEEVNYRKSEEDKDGDERCGDCAFIIMPDECKRVRGKIDQDFTCDLWKRGVAEDLDEALSKKARSVFNALEQNPEGLPADEIKHYGRAGDVANLAAFLKKFVKKGWVEQKGDLYLPTAAYWRSQGHAPWIPFAKAKVLKNVVFSTVNRMWAREKKAEVLLYDKKGKQVARTHATITNMKKLPGLPISWTDLMWIERHGEPSPGVRARMKEDLDEATLFGKVKAALKGEKELRIVRQSPGSPGWGILVRVLGRERSRVVKKLKKKGFRIAPKISGTSIDVLPESLDEAKGAQGRVQVALLDFVKKLPEDSEFTLADVMRRQEFRGVHFKRIMSAAKALEKKGLIWYDGFSNIGPVRA